MLAMSFEAILRDQPPEGRPPSHLDRILCLVVSELIYRDKRPGSVVEAVALNPSPVLQVA